VGSGGPSVGKGGECDVEGRHIQGCSPYRHRLRIDGLVPVSKYWTYWSHAGVMGLISPVAGHQRKVGFAPIASMVALWEKLGMDLQIGQPSCCGLGQEPFFSGAEALLNSVDDYAKGCYTGTTWDTYGHGSYADRAWKVCGVLIRFFTCRVYIDSNHRNSRTWVPLVCDNHHIDILMNLMELIFMLL
jgi:hypothetical protein